MKSPDDAPMTDVEAINPLTTCCEVEAFDPEAVLLELGSPIEWATEAGETAAPMTVLARGVAGEYSYCLWLDGGGTVHAYGEIYSDRGNELFDIEECIASFDTLLDAKAACECHHATGKWE